MIRSPIKRRLPQRGLQLHRTSWLNHRQRHTTLLLRICCIGPGDRQPHGTRQMADEAASDEPGGNDGIVAPKPLAITPRRPAGFRSTPRTPGVDAWTRVAHGQWPVMNWRRPATGARSAAQPGGLGVAWILKSHTGGLSIHAVRIVRSACTRGCCTDRQPALGVSPKRATTTNSRSAWRGRSM